MRVDGAFFPFFFRVVGFPSKFRFGTPSRAIMRVNDGLRARNSSLAVLFSSRTPVLDAQCVGVRHCSFEARWIRGTLLESPVFEVRSIVGAFRSCSPASSKNQEQCAHRPPIPSWVDPPVRASDWSRGCSCPSGSTKSSRQFTSLDRIGYTMPRFCDQSTRVLLQIADRFMENCAFQQIWGCSRQNVYFLQVPIKPGRNQISTSRSKGHDYQDAV